jgi:phage terminase large subunit GpA-like protein
MDYPLIQMATEANRHVEAGATVWQKWTCEHCGSRQTMEKKNTFYKSGRCEECGQVTIIEKCGYTLLMESQPANRSTT